MSLSSSSVRGSSGAFVSSAMLYRSPDGGEGSLAGAGSRRAARGARGRRRQGQLPDGLRLSLQIALQAPQLFFERGQRRIARGLGLDDGLGHVADPPLATSNIVPLPKLGNLTMCVDPLPLIDQQGGEQSPLGFVWQIGHEGFGPGRRARFEHSEQRAEARMSHVLVVQQRQQLLTSLFDVQKQG